MQNLIQMKQPLGFSTVIVLLLLASPMPAGAAQASEAVRIMYAYPEKFTDLGENNYVTTEGRRDAMLLQLAQHVQTQAASRIPAGSRLQITVTDIDMAGGFESWRRNAGHLRIVRSVYPPRINLIFRLVDVSGNTLTEGQRALTNPVFMTSVEYRGDLLRYEKKLLDDWLMKEFPLAS